MNTELGDERVSREIFINHGMRCSCYLIYMYILCMYVYIYRNEIRAPDLHSVITC
jgi:hypothetical protein